MFSDLTQKATAVLKREWAVADMDVRWTVPREKNFGDASTNVALQLAKKLGKKPQEIAQVLCTELAAIKGVERAEVAGTGYVNVTLTSDALLNPGLVAVAWIGFDNPKSLGNGETGSQAALPMWMSYMATALKGVPQGGYAPPEGVVAARINPSTGLRDPSSSTIDFFFSEHLPSGEAEEGDASAAPAPKSPLQAIRDLLF